MTPFIGQIMAVAFDFAPPGWVPCDGRPLAIVDFPALFSLIGTTFGGDGINTFAVPDLRGRSPIGVGQGPGLAAYSWGQRGGVEEVTLTEAQIPQHSHALRASGAVAGDQAPDGGLAAETAEDAYSSDTSGLVAMSSSAIGNAGGNGPHSNLSPYLAVHHLIAVVGIYPERP
ncbi:MAG: tail fiber protein [Myxococcota bacterium]